MISTKLTKEEEDQKHKKEKKIELQEVEDYSKLRQKHALSSQRLYGLRTPLLPDAMLSRSGRIQSNLRHESLMRFGQKHVNLCGEVVQKRFVMEQDLEGFMLEL
jgi:hypothetical protein